MKNKKTSNKTKKASFWTSSIFMFSGIFLCFAGVIVIPLALQASQPKITPKPVAKNSVDASKQTNIDVEIKPQDSLKGIFKVESPSFDLINTYQTSEIKSWTRKDFENIFKYKITAYFKGSNIDQEFKNKMFDEPSQRLIYDRKVAAAKEIDDTETNKKLQNIQTTLNSSEKKTADYENAINQLQAILDTHGVTKDPVIELSPLNPIHGVYTYKNIKDNDTFELDITKFLQAYNGDNLMNFEKFLELIDHFSFDSTFGNNDDSEFKYYKFKTFVLKEYFEKLNKKVTFDLDLRGAVIKQIKIIINVNIQDNKLTHLVITPEIILEKK